MQRIRMGLLAFLMVFAVFAAPISPSGFRIGSPQEVSANAWHCSISAYSWSSGSRIYVQTAVTCPHGHSGWITVGDYAPSPDQAWGSDAYVSGTVYRTYYRWCSPNYQYVVAPYGLFSSGGVAIEAYPGVRYIWCSY